MDKFHKINFNQCSLLSTQWHTPEDFKHFIWTHSTKAYLCFRESSIKTTVKVDIHSADTYRTEVMTSVTVLPIKENYLFRQTNIHFVASSFTTYAASWVSVDRISKRTEFNQIRNGNENLQCLTHSRCFSPTYVLHLSSIWHKHTHSCHYYRPKTGTDERLN
jgi:hypothetical protein